MKKKLTQAQQDILALAIAQGGYDIDRATFVDVAALTVGGYLVPENAGFDGMASGPVAVHATNKGLRVAVAAKAIVQDGIRFHLPEGSPLKDRLRELRHRAPDYVVPALRVVPPKPRDPFDEGFTAAKDGQPASNTWQGQTEASEYDEGFRQGAMWRAQNPPAASA